MKKKSLSYRYRKKGLLFVTIICGIVKLIYAKMRFFCTYYLKVIKRQYSVILKRFHVLITQFQEYWIKEDNMKF